MNITIIRNSRQKQKHKVTTKHVRAEVVKIYQQKEFLGQHIYPKMWDNVVHLFLSAGPTLYLWNFYFYF